MAFSHAKTRAAIITPIRTAKAKLCSKTVIKATKTITSTSILGILPKVLRLAHSNVPILTMIINPVSAAIGTCSIRSAPNMMNTNSITDATIPDNLALAPDEILIKL